MGASSNAMQSLLAQKLMQQSQAPSYGGGAAGPQMQGQVTPVNAASQAIQQAMLMRALQQRQPPPPQQPVQPQVGPGGFALPAGQPLPQTMNAMPVPGGAAGA